MKSLKTIILERYSSKQLENVSIIEVNQKEDLVNIERKEKLVVIVGNRALMFDAIDLRPDMIIRSEKFEEDLIHLDEYIQKQNTILEFKSGHIEVRFPIDSIIYIESYGHYLTIHTTISEFRVRETMTQIINKVSSFSFRQIHKSYIINEHYVQSKTASTITLKNGISLPIGRKYKK